MDAVKRVCLKPGGTSDASPRRLMTIHDSVSLQHHGGHGAGILGDELHRLIGAAARRPEYKTESFVYNLRDTVHIVVSQRQRRCQQGQLARNDETSEIIRPRGETLVAFPRIQAVLEIVVELNLCPPGDAPPQIARDSCAPRARRLSDDHTGNCGHYHHDRQGEELPSHTRLFRDDTKVASHQEMSPLFLE